MKIVDIPQGDERWFQVRAGRPTASEFKRIITPAGKRSKGWNTYVIDLCAERYRPDETFNQFTGNRHTDRGNELEPIARAVFEDVMQLKVEEVGFCTRDDEVIGCSPDGLIRGEDGEYIAGLEIKSPTAKHHALTLIENEMPAEHKPQVHGGMAVTGLNYWYFMSYAERLRPFIVRIERDSYTDDLANKLDAFQAYYETMSEEIMPKLKP